MDSEKDFIQDLVENGSQYNIELAHTHPDDENIIECQAIAKILGIDIEKAITTSCIITAMMIRQRLTGTIEQNDQDKKNYQISFYSDENCIDLEHVITIIDHHVIQSFFNKYTIKLDKMDLSNVREMDGISLWKLLVSPVCNHEHLFIVIRYLPNF